MGDTHHTHTQRDRERGREKEERGKQRESERVREKDLLALLKEFDPLIDLLVLPFDLAQPLLGLFKLRGGKSPT